MAAIRIPPTLRAEVGGARQLEAAWMFSIAFSRSTSAVGMMPVTWPP